MGSTWRRSAAIAAAAALAVAGCVAAGVSSKSTDSGKSPEVQTVKVVAKRFDFTPEEIKVKKGVPVDIELTTADRVHGFFAPKLGLRAEIMPGQTAHLRFTPDTAGTFLFQCDVFCGEGHESMDGKIIVVE
jgi:cytochrome c oxidase subunit 2